jgi:hypothetical protein
MNIVQENFKKDFTFRNKGENHPANFMQFRRTKVCGNTDSIGFISGMVSGVIACLVEQRNGNIYFTKKVAGVVMFSQPVDLTTLELIIPVQPLKDSR